MVLVISINWKTFMTCILNSWTVFLTRKRDRCVMIKWPPISSGRLPQRFGEQAMAYLLVSNQERAAMVLPGQGQEQDEPASCDPGGLQHFTWPQPWAPVLLQDCHGWHPAGNPWGRQPLSFLLLWYVTSNVVHCVTGKSWIGLQLLESQIIFQPPLNKWLDIILRGSEGSCGLQVRQTV